jgi:RimJ/RimL family protein N-acetyltransferase
VAAVLRSPVTEAYRMVMLGDAHVHDLHCPRDSQTITLEDGSRVVIRTLCSGEAPIVQEVFDGMSEQSRRQRFTGPKPRLSQADLELLASIDHENHVAVVAVDPATGRAVGEAHLVRDSLDPGVAEVAFGVVDAWQGRRLGTCLAERLVRRARELGVGRLRATLFAENRRSKALLRRQGSVIDTRFEGASIELLVALS